MIERFVTLGLALGLCLGAAAAAAGADQDNPVLSRERYRIVGERNVFLRDRSTGRRPQAVAVTPAYVPERSIVLTGIVRQDEEYVAFLEDTRTGVTSRVRADEAVARGRIAEIGLGYITYETGEQRVRVEVGRTLGGDLRVQGATSAPAVTGEPAVEAASEETPAAVGAGTGGESAILERLRQQRQKELNKQ